MANMFLQQENLIKQLAVLFAAVVMDRTLCHNDRSACEMMCGFIPNMAHVCRFFCGQTVMFPVILDPKILDPPFEVSSHLPYSSKRSSGLLKAKLSGAFRAAASRD
jgi:hypothetical protein